MTEKLAILATSTLLTWSLAACGTIKTDADGDDGTTDTTTTEDSELDGESDGSFDARADIPDDGWGSDVCHIVFCQTHNYECADCEDNDGDTLIDSRDPDCLGPCDNNETGYNTAIPGGNAAPCKMDCYFDQDTGAGNDDCHWDHHCDPFEPLEINPCDYSETCDGCRCDDWYDAQSEECLDFCLPLTPNGCDCFGCCVLDPDGAEEEYSFIGTPSCSISDTESCSQCTPVPSCLNPCGPCELCLGRTELPPECFDDRCPEGVQPCSLPGDEPCPETYYCITGCCIAFPG